MRCFAVLPSCTVCQFVVVLEAEEEFVYIGLLRRRKWSIASFRGQTQAIEVRDNSTCTDSSPSLLSTNGLSDCFSVVIGNICFVEYVELILELPSVLVYVLDVGHGLMVAGRNYVTMDSSSPGTILLWTD